VAYGFALFAMTSLGVLGSAAAGVVCGDIGTTAPESLIESLHPDFARVRFVDGEACTCDCPEGDTCDWQHTIKADRLLAPGVRLLVVNSNHRTGSGAWDHVTVVRCASGRATLVFRQRYLYGATLTEASPTTLTIVSGDWLDADPMCCPSREKRETFVWDSQRGRFTLMKTVRRPR
jgi:hypothetical protein